MAVSPKQEMGVCFVKVSTRKGRVVGVEGVCVKGRRFVQLEVFGEQNMQRCISLPCLWRGVLRSVQLNSGGQPPAGTLGQGLLPC